MLWAAATMTDEERRVADQIREAFRGVTLGDGIGLMQAQGLDDYAEAETLAKYRASDEKEDWSAIPAEKLNRCYSSLSFFDAEGLRFHLPAFLVAELEGTYDQEVIFYLTYTGYNVQSRFDVLSPAQREAVRQYLLSQLRKRPADDYDVPIIQQALATYWLPSAGI